ncbi:hypothetical protein SLS63_000216 [Diaporthe eres]|uniref:Saccharopine dehydrogenase NADP binding domain-containing protein n=1 Tax=Diaporthe eres TaxID=83184 RepID=A0ABR1PR87_DIAER
MSILHLVPVVTSTVSLWFAFDQYFFLGIFLHKDVETGAKHVLTPYWNTMIGTGLGYVVAPLVSTIASTVAILSTTSAGLLRDKGSYSWYVASAFFAAGHFAFVSAILPKIRNLEIVVSYDTQTLGGVIGRARVCLSSVVYAVDGDAIIEACIEQRTDYVDCAAVPTLIRDWVAKYHEEAEANGVAVSGITES